MSDRVEEMRRARLAGETLAAIGVRYGLTRERVRQLTRGSVPSISCKACGSTFSNAKSNTRLCDSCLEASCTKCGGSFSSGELREFASGDVYHWRCSPKRRRSGHTYVTVERGIYFRVYTETREKVNDLFFTHKYSNGKQIGFVGHQTLEDARAWRAARGLGVGNRNSSHDQGKEG